MGKARKAEQPVLEEIIKRYPLTLPPETVDYRDYLVARTDEGVMAGFAAVVENHKNLRELDPVWVDDQYRDRKLGLLLTRLQLRAQGPIRGRVSVVRHGCVSAIALVLLNFLLGTYLDAVDAWHTEEGR